MLGFLLALVGGTFGGIQYVNSSQQSLQKSWLDTWTHPGQQVSSPNASGVAIIAERIALTVIFGTPDLFANQTMVNQGWVPDCWTLCFSGIHYAEDPTVHVTNEGIDCIGFKVHGTASGTTCALKQNSTILMVSASSGYTPLFTDTSCHATVATTNGFSIIAGTYTAGSPSGGSATDQVLHTWTSVTSATSGLDLACLAWTTGNGANTLYAAGQIGTTTANPGDTVETIWSIVYSSS